MAAERQTMTTQHETAPDLLEQLFEALTATVTAAAASQVEPPAMTTCRIFPSPFAVHVAHHDRAGRVRTFRAPGDPGLAELTAQFLNDGVAALPDAQRRAALALVSRGDAELLVLVDVDQGTAGGALMPSGDAEPVLLFVLHRPATVH